MDKFKHFIQDNKQELDLERPDFDIWSKIEQHIAIEEGKKKAVPIWRWIAAAACLVIISIATYFLLNENKQYQASPTFAKNEHPITKQSPKEEVKNSSKPKSTPFSKADAPIAEIASTKKVIPTVAKSKIGKNRKTPQYVITDVEVGNFSQIIEYQRQYISTLPIYGQQPSFFNDFKQQIKQMDNDEKNVRKDIQKHGLTTNQIESLINIYQQKINLLKQLNLEINRINKSYYQNHLQNDSAKTENPHFLNI